MRKSKNCFKLVEKPDGKICWNGVPIRTVREIGICNKDVEYDFNVNIQQCFTIRKLTNKNLNDDDRENVFAIVDFVGFFTMRLTKKLNSARMKDALYNPPKPIAKVPKTSFTFRNC